jgi:metal-responsive CopG/Arc/MetJ family transcriptional regulator
MTETLNIRVPDRLIEALDRAISERMTSKSEYVRQAVLDRLRREGVDTQRQIDASPHHTE